MSKESGEFEKETTRDVVDLGISLHLPVFLNYFLELTFKV